MRSTKLIKKLTKAEVGNTKTHEIYIRIPDDFDYETFFNNTQQEKDTVIEVRFPVRIKSLKAPEVPESNQILRFVHYINSTNHEKRIPSLKSLFQTYLVSEGDAICLEKIDNEFVYRLTFYSSEQLKVYDKGGLLINAPFGDEARKTNSISQHSPHPLQQIYFGAPGTGKSHSIKNNATITEENSTRTTFHPDSDYSTFIGCYKPIKNVRPVKPLIATEDLIEQASAINGVANQVQFISEHSESIVAAADEKGVSTNKLFYDNFKWHNETYLTSFLKSIIAERRNNANAEITYNFTPQAFTSSYVKAWKNLDVPYFLIIEEINRGNCAQIFGDIFQLLDRDESGYSSYKITPDQDLQNYLCEQFADVDIEDKNIKNGTQMMLPPNLYIWGTMNTSDQSLFPIDSAFKRRWDWKYIPIDYTDRGHYISVGNLKYLWSDFLKKVNDRIEAVTQSEDKKLGYWFAARKDVLEITLERFVSKVVFYLWNDVFKDYSHSGNSIFKGDYSKFHSFFDMKGDAKQKVVQHFLEEEIKINSLTSQTENDTPNEGADSITSE